LKGLKQKLNKLKERRVKISGEKMKKTAENNTTEAAAVV